jgi:pilus assembly protein CpaB
MSDARSSRAGKARIGALGFTVIAVVCAIGFAVFFYSLLASKGYDQEAMRPIVVAAKPLKAGMPIDSQSLVLKPWPSMSIPDGAFASIEGLLAQSDKVPLHTILAGEAVVDSRLSSKNTGSGMAPLIPHDMRGFAVRADRWLTDAEMLYPGAVVDVVASTKVKMYYDEGRRSRDADVAKIILEKVKVVAVNGAVDGVAFARGSDGQTKQKASRGSRAVVTLLVTPAQAEKLSLAKAGSRLDFVLRNSSDEGTMPTEGSQMSDLFDMPGMLVESVAEETGGAARKGKRARKAPRASVRRRASTRSKRSKRSKTKRSSNELVIGE